MDAALSDKVFWFCHNHNQLCGFRTNKIVSRYYPGYLTVVSHLACTVCAHRPKFVYTAAILPATVESTETPEYISMLLRKLTAVLQSSEGQ